MCDKIDSLIHLRPLRFKSKRPPDAEAQNVVPEVGGEPVAGGGAEAPRRVVPLTASGDMPTAFSAGPCRTICGSSAVVRMIAILHPLRHVAGHVVKAERIVLERVDWRGSMPVPRAAAPRTIGVPRADLLAPVIRRRCRGVKE